MGHPPGPHRLPGTWSEDHAEGFRHPRPVTGAPIASTMAPLPVAGLDPFPTPPPPPPGGAQGGAGGGGIGGADVVERIDRVDHRAELPRRRSSRPAVPVPPSCRRSPLEDLLRGRCARALRPFHRSARPKFSGTNRPPFASIGAGKVIVQNADRVEDHVEGAVRSAGSVSRSRWHDPRPNPPTSARFAARGDTGDNRHPMRARPAPHRPRPRPKRRRSAPARPPGPARKRSRNSSAQRPPKGSAAAWASFRVSGVPVTAPLAFTVMSSACPRRRTGSRRPGRRWANSVTPGPGATTVPAKSLPSTGLRGRKTPNNQPARRPGADRTGKGRGAQAPAAR